MTDLETLVWSTLSQVRGKIDQMEAGHPPELEESLLEESLPEDALFDALPVDGPSKGPIPEESSEEELPPGAPDFPIPPVSTSTDYPLGDGDPNCNACKGRGVVEYQSPRSIMPGVLTCECVKERDIRLNMERGWKGLSRFGRINKSCLLEHVNSNLWITCPEKLLRNHLGRLAHTLGPRWRFNVFSDADLMDAWLSRVADDEIYDPEVEAIRRTAVSGRFMALVDLVEPPGLLILRVGVKAARNSAMPEVLLEALQHRSMVNKPTWVVDTPAYQLGIGHIAFDARVGEYLETWDYLELKIPAGTSLPTSVGNQNAGGSHSGLPPVQALVPMSASQVLAGTAQKVAKQAAKRAKAKGAI